MRHNVIENLNLQGNFNNLKEDLIAEVKSFKDELLLLSTLTLVIRKNSKKLKKCNLYKNN